MSLIQTFNLLYSYRQLAVRVANVFFLTMFWQQSQYDSRLRFSSRVLVRVMVRLRLRVRVSDRVMVMVMASG